MGHLMTDTVLIDVSYQTSTRAMFDIKRQSELYLFDVNQNCICLMCDTSHQPVGCWLTIDSHKLYVYVFFAFQGM